METMSRATFGSCPHQTTQKINDKLENYNKEYTNLRNVYDIANAGPKHRFFIYTDAGFMCVSNCILGLGYGTGPDKLRDTLAIGQGGIKVNIDIEEAKRIVRVYRSKNHRVESLWRTGQSALVHMARGESGLWVDHVNLKYTGHRLILPNNMPLTYNDLRYDGKNYSWDTRKGAVKIYGAKLVENSIQALAALIIREQMLRVGKRYPVVLQVHDEIVLVVREEEAEEADKFVNEVMHTPPDWAPALPIACESGWAKSYGEAK